MRELFPPTTTKVKLDTDDRINIEIERKTSHNIKKSTEKLKKK
ncbi:hypothetical protein [Bacillus sp. PS06]|nr:hypothetical protein [Bacillus sp. PS06]